MCYGVGEPYAFGYTVGKAVKFVEVNVNRNMDRKGRLEATTVAEVEVTKRKQSALSNPWLRIDWLAFHRHAEWRWYASWRLCCLPDWKLSISIQTHEICWFRITPTILYSCCSTPLVVLDLIQCVNGVGVTQSMNMHLPPSKFNALHNSNVNVFRFSGAQYSE